MKSHDETISNVFDRIGEYETNQKRKRSVIAKTAVSFCCVCAIALVGVGVLKGRNQNVLYTPTTVTGNTDTAIGITPDNNVIIFNEIGEKVPSKVPSEMGIALFRDDAVPMTKKELNEYFGANVFPTCPDGFTEKPCWLGIYKRNKGTGEVYYDSNQIQYANADNTKGIAVSFSTNGMFYLTKFYLGEKYNDIPKSVINNVEISFAKIDAYNHYYAEFSYNGVDFNIFSDGVTQDEFLSVIYSIIEK